MADIEETEPVYLVVGRYFERMYNIWINAVPDDEDTMLDLVIAIGNQLEDNELEL